MSGRSLALRAVIALTLFAAVILLLGQIVPGAGKRLADADPAWLVLAVGLELLACGGYAVLFHAVFAREPYADRRAAAARRSRSPSSAASRSCPRASAARPRGSGASAAPACRGGRSGCARVSHAPVFNAPVHRGGPGPRARGGARRRPGRRAARGGARAGGHRARCGARVRRRDRGGAVCAGSTGRVRLEAPAARGAARGARRDQGHAGGRCATRAPSSARRRSGRATARSSGRASTPSGACRRSA